MFPAQGNRTFARFRPPDRACRSQDGIGNATIYDASSTRYSKHTFERFRPPDWACRSQDAIGNATIYNVPSSRHSKHTRSKGFGAQTGSAEARSVSEMQRFTLFPAPGTPSIHIRQVSAPYLGLQEPDRMRDNMIYEVSSSSPSSFDPPSSWHSKDA